MFVPCTMTERIIPSCFFGFDDTKSLFYRNLKVAARNYEATHRQNASLNKKQSRHAHITTIYKICACHTDNFSS